MVPIHAILSSKFLREILHLPVLEIFLPNYATILQSGYTDCYKYRIIRQAICYVYIYLFGISNPKCNMTEVDETARLRLRQKEQIG